MLSNNLRQLYAEHSGKVSDKWSLYLEEYDRWFAEFADRPISMLEIGVQNGGSLDVWSRYFSNAEAIIGCDINEDCAKLSYSDPRITLIVGDACAPAIRNRILARSSHFDIVIDDGSHLSSDIVRAFCLYFPAIRDGGMFVAEDLHCSYWDHFEGGLYDPNSSIGFFKLLADVVNHEHWGVPKSRKDILRKIFEKYGCELPEETLSLVRSIEFVNSMCVVRKSHGRATLGRRVIAGSDEIVRPGHLEMNGELYQLDAMFDQKKNAWSNRSESPADDLAKIGRLFGSEKAPEDRIYYEIAAIVHSVWYKMMMSLKATLAAYNDRLTKFARRMKRRLG